MLEKLVFKWRYLRIEPSAINKILVLLNIDTDKDTELYFTHHGTGKHLDHPFPITPQGRFSYPYTSLDRLLIFLSFSS